MKTSTLAIAFALEFSPVSFVYAGPCHDHSLGHSYGTPAKLDDKGIIIAASNGVKAIIKQKQLIEGKSLDEAWGNTPNSAKSISKKGNGYSVVKFDSKDAKKTLYVLLSDVGEIYDANFSGEFSGLKD